jgi:hypothetical protein
MSLYPCVLCHDGKEVGIHTFNPPDDHTTSYTIRSIHAFRTRENKRLSESLRATATHPPRHTFVTPDPDNAYLSLFKEWPRTHHATLWDLYLAIGYDYKKKFYVK